MKRTFQCPLALLLTLVMLLGLLPGAALAVDADTTSTSSDHVLDSLTWTDAGWNGSGDTATGPTATVTTASGGGIQVSISDSVTESAWRAAAISTSLSNITGVGSVTLNLSWPENSTGSFTLQVFLSDSNNTTYGAQASVNASTTPTEVNLGPLMTTDSNGSITSTTANASNFSPTYIAIAIGGNATLPSTITLSNITITAPTVQEHTVTLIARKLDADPQNSGSYFDA